ncbi:MAG: family 16 glycosylhydrolase [Verrucomicrobiota bacterium]
MRSRRGGALLFVFLTALAAQEASATPPPGYYLIWSDEFDGSSLDLSKWWCWLGPDHQATDVPQAVTVSNGCLTITCFNTNSAYYSGTVSSQGLFCYGYYEASIEWNGEPGMWSAFWMNSPNTGLYDGNPSASGAEVDICEHRYTDTGDVDYINNGVQQAVHWDNEAVDEKTAIIGPIGTNLGTGFHTYGLLWDRTNYYFYIDGSETWSTNAGHSDRTGEVTLSSELTNGWYAGNIPTNGYGNQATSTTTMVVDYVRIYAPTTTVFWTGAGTANWTDSNSWLSNMLPNGASDVVFTHFTAGNQNTTLDQNMAVNSLAFQDGGPYSISGNTLMIETNGIDTVSSSVNTTLNSAIVLGANQNWKIAQNLVLAVNGPVSGPGNLTLTWLGTVALAGANTCSGVTTISNGTLQVTGSMTNAIVVAGGTLSGTGVLAGPVSVIAGGTLSPGPGFAQLTLSNTLALGSGSSTLMDVNAATGASDEITGLTEVTYGGALVLNNQSGAFAAGNAFKLFDAASYAGAFASISPTVPGMGLGWNTNTLAVDGTLRVIDVAVSQTTNVVESRSGSSTAGTNNPAFSFSGFSSTISATKSAAAGCTSPGSSRFTSTASTSTSFSVTPTLVAGTAYSVSVSWGYNSGASYQESGNIVVKPAATGVSSTTFPATTTAFSSGSGDAINNTWETVGNITASVTNPLITFTYVSGLTSGRWYADAVRFISQLPSPGAITVRQAGGSLALNWQGNFILQSATNVSGPYADLPGPIVVGPYTNTMSATQQFFRLRQ